MIEHVNIEFDRRSKEFAVNQLGRVLDTLLGVCQVPGPLLVTLDYPLEVRTAYAAVKEGYDVIVYQSAPKRMHSRSDKERATYVIEHALDVHKRYSEDVYDAGLNRSTILSLERGWSKQSRQAKYHDCQAMLLFASLSTIEDTVERLQDIAPLGCGKIVLVHDLEQNETVVVDR